MRIKHILSVALACVLASCTHTKYADSFGFLPENTPEANSEAFQRCLDGGGRIRVRKPGEYRLCWSEDDAEEGRFVRFTVSEGAEALPPPESIQDERAPLPPVVEEPAHADLKAYESCLDNTCWDRNSRFLFLKGGTVFEWRGIFTSEGSWFQDEWYLFTFPAGRPEEARLLNGGISADIRQIFDTGSGWLIRDWSGGILTAGYDGGDLTEAGTPFGDGGSLDIFEGKVPERMLIAGGRI